MNRVNTRPSSRRRPRAAAAMVAALVSVGMLGAACGGDSKVASPATTAQPDTSAPTTVAATVAPTIAATVPDTVAATTADTAPPGSVGIAERPVDYEFEPGVEYTEYVTITDETGALTLDAPAEWADIKTTTVEVNGLQYPRIEASTNLTEFDATYAVPGVRFLAVPTGGGTLEELLEAFAVNGCVPGEIEEYSDNVFAGIYQMYTQCDGTAAVYLVLATDLTNGGDHRYLTVVQAVTSADLVALDRVLETFNTTA